MQEDLGTILKRECGEKKGAEFIFCVNDVLVKRRDLPIRRKHHKEWEHRDDKFLFWLGDDNGQYYFGMKTMSWGELPGPEGLYYGMTKAFTHLKDKNELDAFLEDPNFEWLNTRNDTYVLADRKPEYLWDSDKGKFIQATWYD